MGAPDLLRHLRDAGLVLTLTPAGGLRVAPRGALTEDIRAAIHGQRDALVHALQAEAAVPTAPSSPQTTRRSGNTPTPEQPEPRLYRLTKAEGDAAHAEPWDDAACARFAARVALLMRRGINAADADDAAERLHLRDVQGDGRRLCAECAHLTGRPGHWRCGNARLAQVAPDLPAAIVMQLTRCAGFVEVTT